MRSSMRRSTPMIGDGTQSICAACTAARREKSALSSMAYASLCPSVPAHLDHNLDRIFDPIARVSQCGRQLDQWECVRVDQLRIEPSLPHECCRAMCRALSFAANAKDVDVVAHNIGKVDRDWLMRKRCQTDAAAAIHHPRRSIQRVRSSGTFQNVLHTLAARQALNCGHGILMIHIDHGVSTEALSHLQTTLARTGEDDRLRTQCLGDADPHQPNRSR